MKEISFIKKVQAAVSEWDEKEGIEKEFMVLWIQAFGHKKSKSYKANGEMS